MPKLIMRRNVSFFVFALLLIAASFAGVRLFRVHADAQLESRLDTQFDAQIQHAQFLHATAIDQPLHLSIGLQLRHPTQADALLAAITDPESPHYQQYLTPEQFTQRFAPTTEQVQQVVSYLQGQGLSVTGISPNNLLIDASGSVAQVQQSFQVQINTYQLGNRVFSANTAPPSLPIAIRPLITSIAGMDTSVVYHPLSHAVSSLTPSLSAGDLAAAYDLNTLHNGGIQGQGQSIALFTLDGYQQNDIVQYFQNAHLPMPTISSTLVDSANGAAGQGALETTLDIEMIGSIAPQSNILVYEGPTTTQGMNDTYARIVNEHKAQIVSMSWGLCEGSSGNAELQTLNTIFKQGALEGMSFLAASGDAGAYDCQSNDLAVDSPADDPNVTAVGATSLQVNNSGYSGEAIWSNPTDHLHGPHGSGSGGGLSTFFATPSWQNVQSIHTPYSNGKRQVPDVVAFGDSTTGYSVYCTVANAGCPASGWMKVGGTSVAAPLWAASLLLVKQYMQAGSNGTFGLASPTLYRLFTTPQSYPPFHDITTGNNLYYPASPGYDLASGMGSPDVYNIARDLSPSTPPISAPTPPPTNTGLTGPTALLQNDGFEQGSTPWQEVSGMGVEIVDPTNPHSGQQSAFLCGYSGCDDRIWQTFTVPNTATSIKLTYWWNGTTSETQSQCLDTLSVQLVTADGTTLRTLQQSCNSDAKGVWTEMSFDLSNDLAAYASKAITLLFHGTNGQIQSTAFFVDDVALIAS